MPETKPKQIDQIEILKNDDRIFKAWGTVEVVDKEGDYLPINEFKKIMPTMIKRGGVLMDRHSNKQIGKILNYEFKEKQTKEGLKEGVLLTGQIFNDYSLDDMVWDGVKKGIYKGLSFGGLNKKTSEKLEKGGLTKVLTDIEGFEFSLVPGMGNQEATMEEINYLAKSDGTDINEDGETSEENKHYHLYTIDSQGNGRTLGTLPRESEDHKHQITNGIVQETNNHTHTLIRKLVEKDSHLKNTKEDNKSMVEINETPESNVQSNPMEEIKQMLSAILERLSTPVAKESDESKEEKDKEVAKEDDSTSKVLEKVVDEEVQESPASDIKPSANEAETDKVTVVEKEADKDKDDIKEEVMKEVKKMLKANTPRPSIAPKVETKVPTSWNDVKKMMKN